MAQQGQPVEHGREPCPDRILDDIGGAFGMGALGGGAWHLYKGLRNSPKGHKLSGALETLRRESPRIGGNFANWGLMFSVFDCTCLYVRKKEDPFNAIIAGAATGGFLSIRSGLRPAFRAAMFGGVLLALIEGLGITLQKMTAPPAPNMPLPPQAMEPLGPIPPPGTAPAGLGPSLDVSSSSSGLGLDSSSSSSSSSGSSGGSWWSWLSGGEEKPQEPVGSATHHIQEEGFKPHDFQSEALKH